MIASEMTNKINEFETFRCAHEEKTLIAIQNEKFKTKYEKRYFAWKQLRKLIGENVHYFSRWKLDQSLINYVWSILNQIALNSWQFNVFTWY